MCLLSVCSAGYLKLTKISNLPLHSWEESSCDLFVILFLRNTLYSRISLNVYLTLNT